MAIRLCQLIYFIKPCKEGNDADGLFSLGVMGDPFHKPEGRLRPCYEKHGCHAGNTHIHPDGDAGKEEQY